MTGSEDAMTDERKPEMTRREALKNIDKGFV